MSFVGIITNMINQRSKQRLVGLLLNQFFSESSQPQHKLILLRRRNIGPVVHT